MFHNLCQVNMFSGREAEIAKAVATVSTASDSTASKDQGAASRDQGVRALNQTWSYTASKGQGVTASDSTASKGQCGRCPWQGQDTVEAKSFSYRRNEAKGSPYRRNEAKGSSKGISRARAGQAGHTWHAVLIVFACLPFFS